MIESPSPELLIDNAAEAATLGSMLLDTRVIPGVLDLVTRESFVLPEHREIFDAILAVWMTYPRAEIDGLLVRSRLEETNRIEAAGGLPYLESVITSVPCADNAVYYATRVANRCKYRVLWKGLEEIRHLLLAGGDVVTMEKEMCDMVAHLSAETTAPAIIRVKDCATNVAVATQNEVNLVKTGFGALDWILPGIAPGDMVIVAARPSIGKTAFALAWMLRAAAVGKRCVFFTLEMSPEALIERCEASMAKVSLNGIKRRTAPQQELDRFYGAALELSKLDISIIPNCSTAEKMVSVLRQCQREKPVDLVFLDYLGLMQCHIGNRNRNEQVTEISRGLKLMAQSERVPIIVVSQLNRECEGRENHRPRLSDLRDSGSLEQDADVVLLLHREDYYRKLANPECDKLDGLADVIVAKARNGPTGVAQLLFIDNEMRFENLAEIETEPKPAMIDKLRTPIATGAGPLQADEDWFNAESELLRQEEQAPRAEEELPF